MNTEHKATELNEAELDQVTGGNVYTTGFAEMGFKAERGKSPSYKLGSGHLKHEPKGFNIGMPPG